MEAREFKLEGFWEDEGEWHLVYQVYFLPNMFIIDTMKSIVAIPHYHGLRFSKYRLVETFLDNEKENIYKDFEKETVVTILKKLGEK